jgi:hypothetical protein
LRREGATSPSSAGRGCQAGRQEINIRGMKRTEDVVKDDTTKVDVSKTG